MSMDNFRSAREALEQSRAQLEEAKHNLVHAAHKELENASTFEELREAINFLYWQAPELDVAEIRCSTRLRYSQFRQMIEPYFGHGVECIKNGCDQTIPAFSRSQLHEIVTYHHWRYPNAYCPRHATEMAMSGELGSTLPRSIYRYENEEKWENAIRKGTPWN